MCMKYVNANVNCFKSIDMDNNRILSYNAPFESIKSTNDSETLLVNNFTLVTQINFLGTNNPEHLVENPLEQRRTIDFIIRLTKCTKIEENRIGFDLDSFSINLSDMTEQEEINLACFGFLNYTRITNINQLDIPGGLGKYVIKVLIKDSDESEYSIQSMSKLTIM